MQTTPQAQSTASDPRPSDVEHGWFERACATWAWSYVRVLTWLTPRPPKTVRALPLTSSKRRLHSQTPA